MADISAVCLATANPGQAGTKKRPPVSRTKKHDEVGNTGLPSKGVSLLPMINSEEAVFFSVRPIVLSLAFSTMFNSTTFSSSRRRLQRANPSGAGEPVRAINLASAAPSKIRGRAEFGLYLRFSVASNPSSTSCCRVRETVLMLVSSAAEIALSLHPSPPSDTSAFSRMRALVSSCAELLPARINASSRSRSSMVNFTTYFLPAISFPATNHLHRCIAATEIQRNTPDSRTRATSLLQAPRGAGLRVYTSGQKRGVTDQIKRELRRRAAVDPVIGHLKADHRRTETTWPAAPAMPPTSFWPPPATTSADCSRGWRLCCALLTLAHFCKDRQVSHAA